MRRVATAVASLAALAVAAPTPAQAAPVKVSIEYASFTPGAIDALPGDTVTWNNQGGRTHTVTSDGDAFDSGDLVVGRSFSFVFTTPGTYTYHCAIHREMFGVVHVRRVTLEPLPPRAVPAGISITLRGRTADPSAAVQIQRDSGSGFQTVASATPLADGTWRARVSTTRTAHYRAALGSDLSETRRLLVVDRHVQARRAHGGISVQVIPAAPHARVALELYLRERFGWWLTRRARLDSHSRTTFAVSGPVRARAVLLGHDGWTAFATSPVVRIPRR